MEVMSERRREVKRKEERKEEIKWGIKGKNRRDGIKEWRNEIKEGMKGVEIMLKKLES